MPGFVKTPADEKLWSKAKRQAKKGLGLKKNPKSGEAKDSFYAYANKVFHNLKKQKKKRKASLVSIASRISNP
jgi:hypothetical protein